MVIVVVGIDKGGGDRFLIHAVKAGAQMKRDIRDLILIDVETEPVIQNIGDKHGDIVDQG